MKLQLKRNDRIGLVFFVACVISTSLIWLFEERFDADSWKTNPRIRYKMVDDILEQKFLIGKTKDEIIVLLGKPSLRSSSGKDIFLYRLGEPPSFFESKKEQLVIVFKNEKAVKISVAIE